MEVKAPMTTAVVSVIETPAEEEEEEDRGEDSFILRRQQQQQQQQQRRVTKLWNVFGRRLPRSEIVFFCQTFLIYAVVVTSLVNLTLKNGPINLWIALLGSCLGYLLPHPSIDRPPKDAAGHRE